MTTLTWIQHPQISHARRTAAAILLFGIILPMAHAQRQRRVAVLNFDVSNDARLQAQRNNIHSDLGRIMADLMISQLVNGGRVTVIERDKLDQIIKEQNLENSDRNDPQSAAKIGKLLGIDDVVIGAVTGFTIEQKGSHGNTGIHLGSRIGVPSLNQQSVTVTAATTARIVDVNTGAIIASADGAGQSVRKSSGVSLSGYNGGSYSTSDKDFANSLVGEATTKAVVQAAVLLDASPALSAPIAAAPRTAYEGEVADVSGNTLILTVGSGRGARVGDTVEISRPGRVIKNPDTGAVLRVVSDHLGEGKITEVDASSATVTYSGTPVKVKDRAKYTPQ